MKVYQTIGNLGVLYDLCLGLFGYRHSVRYFVRALQKVTGESPKRILDAGCGTGEYTLALLETFPEAHVLAFDREPALMERVRGKIEAKGFASRTTLFTADVVGLLEKIGEPVDIIISSGVLEYVPLESTIKNLASHLKPGGYFFYSPLRDTAYARLVGFFYQCKPRTEAEGLSAFERSDFRLVKRIHLPPFHPASFKETYVFQKK